MENTRLQTWFYIFLLGVAILLNLYIFKAFFMILMLAIILGVVFKPVYRKILKETKRELLAALITTFAVFLIVILPLTFIGYEIFVESRSLYLSLVSDGSSNTLVSGIINLFKGRLDQAGLSVDLNTYVRQGAEYLFNHFGQIFSSIFSLIFSFVLVLFTLFYVLRDGQKFKQLLSSLSPLPQNVDSELISKMEGAINSVIRGQFVIAVLQSIIAMIGFAIFGVPNPVLWGSLVIVAAFIPTIGTGLVMVPAILYLYFTGEPMLALGMAIWAFFAVSLIDNVLGPFLINRGLKIHPFLVLLSVLGGISAFGPVGVLIGPIILALLFALIDARGILSSKDN
ncbi:MAG: AI-2E family transporter [Patescibacteria group bacterium]